jgi:hypothetical protein
MVVCASNLRQVGVGFAYYSDEFNGIIAPHAFFLEKGNYVVPVRGEPYWQPGYVIFTDMLWRLKYVQDWRIYQDPSDPWIDDAPAVDRTKGNGTRALSYALNEQYYRSGGGISINRQPQTSFHGAPATERRYPSRTVLVNEWRTSDKVQLPTGYENRSGSAFWDPMTVDGELERGSHIQNLEIVHPAHLSKSANLLMTDFHVERVSWGVQTITPEHPTGNTQMENWRVENGFPELGTSLIWDYRTKAKRDAFNNLPLR